MRYVKARQENADREEAYRIYMTEMIRVTAMDVRGRDGLPRFYDLMHPVESKEAPEEIIERLKNGINSI